jgi:hypothetical protein
MVADIAERLGWHPADIPEVAGRSPKLSWATPDGASVGLYSEPAFDCRYLDFVGPDLEQLSWNIGRFGVHITAPMVLGAARRAEKDEDRVRIAGQIACVFPRGLSAAGVEQLRSWYEQGGDALRDAVLAAIEYRNWPEAAGLLVRIHSDANEARSERAARVQARIPT